MKPLPIYISHSVTVKLYLTDERRKDSTELIFKQARLQNYLKLIWTINSEFFIKIPRYFEYTRTFL